MIHAYLFITINNSNHGKDFKKKMKEINDMARCNITVAHSFNEYAPVYFYRCDGPCRSRPPDFGWIKTNAPHKPNPKHGGHARTCDGYFHQVYDTRKELDVSPNKVKRLTSLVGESGQEVINENTVIQPLAANELSKPEQLHRNSAINLSMNIKQEFAEEWGGKFEEIDLITDLDAPITDEMFANYDENQQKLLCVEFLNVKPTSLKDKNFCILCELFVADEQIYEHLFDCSGSSAEQIQYQLPFFRVPNIL